MGETSVFSDPNFYNLLAGIGAGLDPNGVGGALGRATIQYNRSKAAQNALAGQDAKRDQSNASTTAAVTPAPTPTPTASTTDNAAYIRDGVNYLGGLTPEGQTGVSSVALDKNGGLTIKANTPLNPQGPYSTDAAQPAADTTATATAPTIAAQPRRSTPQLRDVIPFY